MSSRQKPKDLHSLDSKQYKQKMELPLEAATKFFQSANNDSLSNGRNLQKHTDLAEAIRVFTCLLTRFGLIRSIGYIIVYKKSSFYLQPQQQINKL